MLVEIYISLFLTCSVLAAAIQRYSDGSVHHRVYVEFPLTPLFEMKTTKTVA